MCYDELRGVEGIAPLYAYNALADFCGTVPPLLARKPWAVSKGPIVQRCIDCSTGMRALYRTGSKRAADSVDLEQGA